MEAICAGLFGQTRNSCEDTRRGLLRRSTSSAGVGRRSGLAQPAWLSVKTRPPWATADPGSRAPLARTPGHQLHMRDGRQKQSWPSDWTPQKRGHNGQGQSGRRGWGLLCGHPKGPEETLAEKSSGGPGPACRLPRALPCGVDAGPGLSTTAPALKTCQGLS